MAKATEAAGAATLTPAQLAEKLKVLDGKVETPIQQIPATKVALAEPGRDHTPVTVPILLIVMRLKIGISEQFRRDVEEALVDLRTTPGMPPIVLCPPGINLTPVFEPAEMSNWRLEIQRLRREKAELEDKLAQQQGRMNSLRQSAAQMQEEKAD